MPLHNIVYLKSGDHGVTMTLGPNFFKCCWLSKLRCRLNRLLLTEVKEWLKWRTPSACFLVRINKANLCVAFSRCFHMPPICFKDFFFGYVNRKSNIDRSVGALCVRANNRLELYLGIFAVCVSVEKMWFDYWIVDESVSFSSRLYISVWGLSVSTTANKRKTYSLLWRMV